jgi:hypothetical protein
MSDDRTYSERQLPLLGIVLLVEAALAALPPMATLAVKGTGSWPGVSWLPFVLGHLVFPGVLGALVVATRRRTTGTALLQVASLIAIAGNELSFVGWASLGVPRALALCEPISSLLLSVAQPVLWGSALVRLRDPANASLQSTGRKAAGLVQLAFIFRFAARFQFLGSAGSFSSINAGYAVWSLVEIVESLILLWASVESVRSTPDVDAVRDRAARVHKLLRVWLVVIFLGSTVTNVLQLVASSDSVLGLAYQMLNLVTFLTLTVTAAAAVARHCGARTAGVQFPAPEHPPGRSGDVQSTGEPL